MCEYFFFLLYPHAARPTSVSPDHAGEVTTGVTTGEPFLRDLASQQVVPLLSLSPETEARFSLTPLVPCSTSPPQSSPPTAQSKPVQIPAPAASHNAHRHAQPALPPAPLPHPRRHLHLLPLPIPLPGPGRGAGASQGGGDGADGHGGRDRLQRRGHERDAAAAGPVPALRALHLLRRAQGRLRPRTMLLRHQLQHPQPPLRVLLIHAQVLPLPRMQPLSRPPHAASVLFCFFRLAACGGFAGDSEGNGGWGYDTVWFPLPDPGA